MQAVAAPGVDDSLGGPRPLGGPSCWQCGAVGGVHVLPCPAGSVVSGRGARAAHLPEHPWHGVRAGVRWAMAFSQDRALSNPRNPRPKRRRASGGPVNVWPPFWAALLSQNTRDLGASAPRALVTEEAPGVGLAPTPDPCRL